LGREKGKRRRRRRRKQTVSLALLLQKTVKKTVRVVPGSRTAKPPALKLVGLTCQPAGASIVSMCTSHAVDRRLGELPPPYTAVKLCSTKSISRKLPSALRYLPSAPDCGQPLPDVVMLAPGR
jgi:hypothetical protein